MKRKKKPGMIPTPIPGVTRKPHTVVGVSLGEWRRLAAAGQTPPPDCVSHGKVAWTFTILARWLRARAR